MTKDWKTAGAKPKPLRHRHAGTNIAEYALVGSSILVVALAGLFLTGGNLDTLFNLLKSDMGKHAQIATAANAKQLAAESSFQASQNAQPLPSSVPVSTNITAITLPDGTKLLIPSPDNLSQSIMTVGANGTTQMLASSLEALAKQLVQDGKIDAAGSNAIMTLANLAHQQADIANIIETKMKTCGCDATTAMNSTVQYNGQAYKLSDLSALIATGSANANGTYNYGPQASQFWGAYNNLWPAGAMKDPAVSGIIDTYVHEIANLSDSNRVILYKMGQGYGGTPTDYQQSEAQYMQSIGYASTAALLQSKTGATVTNLGASTICTTGANQDSGSHCSVN